MKTISSCSSVSLPPTFPSPLLKVLHRHGVVSFIYRNGELYPRHSEQSLSCFTFGLGPHPCLDQLPACRAEAGMNEGQLDLPRTWHFRTGAKIRKRAPDEIDAGSDWEKKEMLK